MEKLRVALRQLAEGLAALHRANRLHRDLNPAKVLVFARDGRLVICDFGLVTVGTNVLGASTSGASASPGRSRTCHPSS